MNFYKNFVFFLSVLLFNHSYPLAFDYIVAGDSALFHQLPAEFMIDRLVVQADVPIDLDEFYYLTGLKEKTVANALMLSCACFYLKQSRRWQLIQVQVNPTVAGKEIVFTLKAQWRVNAISVRGMWFGKDSIKQRYLLNVGEPFDQAKHDESLNIIRMFLKKAGYRAAQVESIIKRDEQKKIITITLVLHKGPRFKVKDITINTSGQLGNFKEKTQKKAMSLLNGKYYSEHNVTLFMRFLRKLLVQHRMPCAEILVTESMVGHAGLKLTFTIDCSAKNKVKLVGNKQVSYKQLINYLIHDDEELRYISVPFLMNKIKQYYHDNGFLMVRVTAQQEKDGWRIFVDEGARVIISKVVLKGVPPERVSHLQILCKKLINARSINEELFQVTQDAIIDYYYSQGFLDASVKEHEFVALADGTYCLELTVDEGTQHFLSANEITSNFLPQRPLLGKAVIIGNSCINHKRFRQLFSYKEGEPYDLSFFNKTFNQLGTLGIFESLRVFPLVENDPYGNRPMIIDVDVGNPFEAQVRLGLVGTNNLGLSTYTVGVSLLGKNFTNRADTITVNAELTRFCRDIALWYRYPCIAGLPLAVQLQLFDKKTDCFSSNESNQVLYTALQRGIGAQGDFLVDYVCAALYTGVEAINITHLVEPCARAIIFEPTLRNRYEPYFYVDPSLTINFVDDVINPHAGMITHVDVRGMFANNHVSASFIRFLLEQSFFVPCCSWLVGAVRLRAGYIACKSFACLAPSERFYLGGACSIRAYQQDYMPPVVYYCNNGQQLWAPLGSRIMASINAELRIALRQKLGLVIFQDIGALKNEKTSSMCVAGATGVGIRYLTPIGPLRFDVGMKNKPAANDCLPFAWFLTIGHAF